MNNLSVVLKQGRQQLELGRTLYEHILKYLQDPDSISDLKRIHAIVTTNGLLSKSVLASRLIRNYSLLTGVGDARQMFDSLPKHSVHTYNYMIKAYVDVGHHELALRLYSQMFSVEAIPPDSITLNLIARASTCLEDILVGKIIHGHVLVNGFDSDLYLATSFIDFYSKCDCIDDARKVFDRTTEKDDFVWTVMISGYLRSCDYCKALGMFSSMREAGRKGTIVTWNALLAGLVHGGLVSDALREFRLMQMDGVLPDKITLATILPAFSRFATLKFGLESHAYIIRMGFESDLLVASSLVDMYAKCGRNQHDWNLAEIAKKHILGCKDIGGDAGYHIMMSNIYAEAGQWGDAAKCRIAIRDGRLKKRTGFSWIEYVFVESATQLQLLTALFEDDGEIVHKHK
ncbi:hypothetical protein ACLOJK_017849 [Asimina triloba]